VPGAEAKLQSALKVALDVHERQIEADALNRLAILAYMRDEHHRVVDLFREAAEAAKASGNLRLQAGILGNYAGHLLALGEMESAQEALTEAQDLARRVGSRQVLFLTLLKSSGILIQRGDTARAEAALLEAERVAKDYGHKGFIAVSARGLGGFYRHVDLAKARQRLETALELTDPGSEEALNGELGLIRVALDEAQYEAAEAMLRDVRSTYSSAEFAGSYRDTFHVLQALIFVGRKEYRQARGVLDRVADAQQAQGVRHQVQRTKARIAAALGDAAQARATVQGLLEEARASGDVLLELEDRIVLGEIELASGDVAAGRAELAKAARRARSLGLFVIAERAQRAG
jgi:ATP/maltotriose-dependent transcriptional regulator MalT